MTVGSFPSSESERKAIIILDGFDVDKLRYELGGANFLLHDQVYVLELPNSSDHPVIENLKNSGLLESKQVLIQNPYNPNEYEKAQDAVFAYSLEKFTYFSLFCSLLGAKAVQVKQVEQKSNNRTISISINAGIPDIPIGIQGSYKDEQLNNFLSQIILEDEYFGSEPNVIAAENLLNEKRLLREPSMLSLLQTFKLGSNPLQKRKLSLNISKESKHNVSILTQVDVPSFLNFGFSFDMLSKENVEYTLQILVEF